MQCHFHSRNCCEISCRESETCPFYLLFFFCTYCIFFLTPKDRGFGETEMPQWFSSDIGLGNELRLRYQMNSSQILGFFGKVDSSLCQYANSHLSVGSFLGAVACGGIGTDPNELVDHSRTPPGAPFWMPFWKFFESIRPLNSLHILFCFSLQIYDINIFQ